MARLLEIEGLEESSAATLGEAGIKNQEALLLECATPKGRKALAEKTGIAEKTLLGWANRADLNRIKGIGKEYADLLEAAGVDTVPELARRKADNLYQKLVAVNADKALVRQLPRPAAVAGWVEQAKALPRSIEY